MAMATNRLHYFPESGNSYKLAHSRECAVMVSAQQC